MGDREEAKDLAEEKKGLEKKTGAKALSCRPVAYCVLADYTSCWSAPSEVAPAVLPAEPPTIWIT